MKAKVMISRLTARSMGILLLATMLAGACVLWGEGVKPLFGIGSHPDPVRVEALVNDHRAVRGKPFTLRIQLTIQSDFHINSDHPKDKYLIPTRITMKNTSDFSFGPAKFPPSVERKFEFSPEELSVFEGEFEVTVQGLSRQEGALGHKIIMGSVRYQACDQSTCYPPRTVAFEAPVDIVAK